MITIIIIVTKPNRNSEPPTYALRGLRARRQSKYKEIEDFPLCGHGPASREFANPSRNLDPPAPALRGPGARHESKYEEINDYLLRAWPRQPIICRAKPKLRSSSTHIERHGGPSPSPSPSPSIRARPPSRPLQFPMWGGMIFKGVEGVISRNTLIMLMRFVCA